MTLERISKRLSASVSARVTAVSGRLRRKLALPGAVVGLSLLGADIVAVSSWRWAPTALAALLSILVVVGSWLVGRRLRGDRRWLEHLSAITVLVAAALLLARHQPTWWPCDIACQGGRGYEYLGSTPVVKLAFYASLALQVALASCHLWSRPRPDQADDPPTPAWIQAFAWAMVGGSAFYLMTSFRLGSACHQCLAYHTAVLALIGPLRAGHLRAFSRIASATAGFLLLLVAYGPALRVDVEPPHPGAVLAPLDAAERAWERSADTGRRIGVDEATLTLELAIDFQCPHCAELHDALMRALADPLADGRVRVIVRHVVRAYEPASPSLARWAFAAAAEGRHRAYVSAMLGSHPGASDTELAHGPSGQAVGVDALERQARAHAAAVAELVEGDKARLSQLRFVGRTPLAVLQSREGQELARWSGEFAAAAVIAAITKASADAGNRAPAPPGPGSP